MYPHVTCFVILFFFSVTVRYRFQQWLDENRDSHVTRISETLSTKDALYIRLPGTGKGTSPSGVPGFKLVSFAGCIGYSERVSFCLPFYVISLSTYSVYSRSFQHICTLKFVLLLAYNDTTMKVISLLLRNYRWPWEIIEKGKEAILKRTNANQTRKLVARTCFCFCKSNENIKKGDIDGTPCTRRVSQILTAERCRYKNKNLHERKSLKTLLKSYSRDMKYGGNGSSGLTVTAI